MQGFSKRACDLHNIFSLQSLSADNLRGQEDGLEDFCKDTWTLPEGCLAHQSKVWNGFDCDLAVLSISTQLRYGLTWVSRGFVANKRQNIPFSKHGDRD